MGLTATALADTRAAFDAVASTYGEENDRNPVIGWMRARALDWLCEELPPGARVLDLGCGPGPDTVRLAALGFDVTGLEWSSRMAAEATARLHHLGLSGAARVYPIGIHETLRWPDGQWDAVLSNLGALNCVPDLPGVARALAAHTPTGASVVASVIGRVCPWEWLIHGRKGDWPRVRLRFQRGFVPVPLEGHTVWTQYLSPRDVVEAFEPAGFELVRLRALGLCVPPPYTVEFCRRHPRVLRTLQTCDDYIAKWPVIRHCGDHMLIQMRRL